AVVLVAGEKVLDRSGGGQVPSHYPLLESASEAVVVREVVRPLLQRCRVAEGEVRLTPELRAPRAAGVDPCRASTGRGAGKRSGRPSAVYVAVGVPRSPAKGRAATAADQQGGPVRLGRPRTDRSAFPDLAQLHQLAGEVLPAPAGGPARGRPVLRAGAPGPTPGPPRARAGGP